MTNFLQVVSFDPLIVQPAEGVALLHPGTNITIDNTDPKNPIISSTATGGGGGASATDADNGDGTGTLTITSSGSVTDVDNGDGTGTLTI